MINGEIVVESLDKISEKIDIVDIFRPSKETPGFAEEAVKIGAKTLWLQYGIKHEEAKKISEDANIKYIENKCIKQEYQSYFKNLTQYFQFLKLVKKILFSFFFFNHLYSVKILIKHILPAVVFGVWKSLLKKRRSYRSNFRLFRWNNKKSNI